jgi:hypothetical protein
MPPGLQPPTISKASPGDPLLGNVETQWQPTEAREPTRVNPRDVPPRVELFAPERTDKDRSMDRYYQEPPPIESDRKGKSASPNKPGVPSTFPNIGQFTVVKDKVFAGLRPPLDGLDWLQTNGVRTVVQLRLPGVDDSVDRRQVEKRGIRYIPFEVSPQTLTMTTADAFIALVRNGSRESIFIYDQDGALAGAMWYLYLRRGEFMNDDAAQLRSLPLGLQINRAGQHRDMWIAVRAILGENTR